MMGVMVEGSAQTVPSDAVVIAVDGGGSKTDLWALDLDGNVLTRLRGGGSSPQLIGLPAARAVIDSLVREAIVGVGGRPVLQTSLYLSGLDLPVEIEAFQAAVDDLSWAAGVTGRRAVVDNDLFALLRAGTLDADAVALVCGTGINCIGVRADGRQVRYPALGAISGDWGGGWFLGERALWHAARAMDGRGPATDLTVRVPAALGLASVRDVTEALHLGRLPSEVLSTLSPVVFEAARAGDAVAGSIVDRQAEEVVLMVTATIRRLDLLGDHVTVVLGGGVLAANDPRLMSLIITGLAGTAPHASIALVTTRPILGAAVLALESVGRTEAARRLAADVTSPRTRTPSPAG